MFETRPAVGVAKFGHYTVNYASERHSNSLNISEICLKITRALDISLLINRDFFNWFVYAV
jgi:hypothetical protein